MKAELTENEWERNFYELAIKLTGAIQAARWSTIAGGGGYVYSFNGPHSLFVDTIRSLRALSFSHILGHALMAENDRKISLLGRLIEHARATAEYAIYYGEGRDFYDVRGRTAHESIFNVNDGQLSLPEFSAGIFTIHYLDTRIGLGDVWICRRTGVSPAVYPTVNLNHSEDANPWRGLCAKRPKPLATSTSNIRQQTAFRIGIPARLSSTSLATGPGNRRSV